MALADCVPCRRTCCSSRRWPLTAAAAKRVGGLAVLGGVDPYLGGSVLYFVLLLPLVLVLGLALGVVAGGALQLWGARPLLAAAVVGVTAAALGLASLSWFDGWERIPALTVIAYGGPVALLAGLLTVRDARRLGRPRHLARARPRRRPGARGDPGRRIGWRHG